LVYNVKSSMGKTWAMTRNKIPMVKACAKNGDQLKPIGSVHHRKNRFPSRMQKYSEIPGRSGI
jgi:hypothetical protein